MNGEEIIEMIHENARDKIPLSLSAKGVLALSEKINALETMANPYSLLTIPDPKGFSFFGEGDPVLREKDVRHGINWAREKIKAVAPDQVLQPGQVAVDAVELDRLRAAAAWAEKHCNAPAGSV